MMFKKKKNIFKFTINRVIKVMIISDLIIVGGFGLISPIFAVFIVDNLVGADLKVIGIASSIYLVSQSLFQIPFAKLIDKKEGEKDDFLMMLIGSLLFSAIPLMYLVIKTPIELYIVQFFYGFFGAIALPAWYAIFTRHIDKTHEGYDWSVYNTLVGFGAALAAGIGGYIANKYGFAPLFILVSLMNFVGSFSLIFIYKNMTIGKVLSEK